MHHTNNTSYIPFKLSLEANNYSKWRQMLFILYKFNVEDHIEFEPQHECGLLERRDQDCIVDLCHNLRQLYDVIMSLESTAYHLCNQLHNYFCDSMAGQAVHLGLSYAPRSRAT